MIEYSPLIVGLINAFREQIGSKISQFGEEAAYFFDSGLPEYIQTQNDKFSKTKTFLFRSNYIDFAKTYFPITLLGKSEIVIKNNVWDLFLKDKCVLISGEAGSGKTMLLKNTFLQAIASYVKIPIVVELRNLKHKETSFFDYIGRMILDNRLATGRNVLERLLEEGSFVFLLDGYDEIYSEDKQQITDDIDKFIDKYNSNFFLITSRPGSNIESMPRFAYFKVANLNKEQIDEFITKQTALMENPQLGETIKGAIKKEENKDYQHYLRNPLLLSMFILVFNDHPILPRHKSKFYWNVFDTLCSRHDSITKLGAWQHERHSKLTNEELELLLKYFSYKSYFDGEFAFDRQYLTARINEIKSKLNFKCTVEEIIYDLTVSISIITVDGNEYKFPHRSLQEYFTASIISSSSEQKRIDIYSSNMLKAGGFGSDNYRNIWGLFLELDELCFTRKFIIEPMRQLVTDVYSITDKYDKYVYYFSQFGYSSKIVIDNLKVVESNIWYNQNHLTALCEFIKSINVMFPTINIDEGSVLTKLELEELLDVSFITYENYNTSPYKNRNDVSDNGVMLAMEYDKETILENKDEFVEFAEKWGLATVIDKSLKGLMEIIDNIEKDVQDKYNTRASLLEL